MVKIQKKKAKFIWTKHRAVHDTNSVVLPSHQNKTPARFHGVSDTDHSDKKTEDNKGTNSQLIFSWTPPGQLRKKTTDLKGSQISEHPRGFLLKIRQLQLLHERNKKNFLRTTKYSFHLMYTEDCQKLSNKEKETKFN